MSNEHAQLLDLFDLIREHLNAIDPVTQSESLRRVARLVLEIEKTRLHQIPDEYLMPQNGTADGFVRTEDGDIHVQRTEGAE